MGAQRITDFTPLAGGRGVATSTETRQSRVLLVRGQVVVAPASESDSMIVVVQVETGVYGKEVPPGNWAPRGVTLPAVGNECLVKYDDQGDVWVGSDWNPF